MSKKPAYYPNRSLGLVFVGGFWATFAAGLFVPTVEMFKGDISIGRLPLYVAYVGIFEPHYMVISIPIVAVHLFVSVGVAWLLQMLFNRLWAAIELIDDLGRR